MPSLLLCNYNYNILTPDSDEVLLRPEQLLQRHLDQYQLKIFPDLDIKNMYSMSIMAQPEYMFLDATLIPKEFLDEYNLHDKIHNGKIYVKIKQGMHGLN